MPPRRSLPSGSVATGESTRVPLSRERVVDAAIALADAEGLEALSMRRLAGELGVATMSLYNHVADKAELQDAMADRIAGTFTVEPAASWHQVVRAWVGSTRAGLLAHERLIPVLLAPARGSVVVQRGRQVVDVLVEGGMALDDAVYVVRVAARYLAGAVLLDSVARRGERPARRARLDEVFGRGLESLLDGLGAELDLPAEPA